MSSPIKLIVGLGNPGDKYRDTRHNAGFWFIEQLALNHSLSFNPTPEFKAELCRLQSTETDCWFCKPMNFINRSGYTVKAIADFHKISAESILLIHDELSLDPGIARLKINGGHNGHNGLRDIFDCTGKYSFNRLQLGIGHPKNKDDTSLYILNKPSEKDHQNIDNAIALSLEIMPQILNGDIHNAMNILYHKFKNRAGKNHINN